MEHRAGRIVLGQKRKAAAHEVEHLRDEIVSAVRTLDVLRWHLEPFGR